MSPEDWSPSDLPAISYIRVAPTIPDEAARQVERQRAQIASRAIVSICGWATRSLMSATWGRVWIAPAYATYLIT